MYIDIRIPWEPNKKLGLAYTRIIESINDWVLILDSDVLPCLTNSWYDKCLNAIETLGHAAGWISAVTNRIGCPLQKHIETDNYQGDNLDIHRTIAEVLSEQKKGQIVDVTNSGRPLSGFFILSHKEALQSIGKLPEKFLGLDNWICDRLREHGYRLFILPDLYVYHGYKRLWKAGEK